jgi:SAM-dependent methyltransferase
MWSDFEEVIFNPGRLARAPADVDGVVRLCRLQPPAHVLDLCCGPARHSVELAKRGYTVTGVDLDSRYLERAARGAATAEVDVELVNGDARDFSRPRTFDAVINMYSSFGYFETIADDRAVLGNIFTSLKPGGVLLIETMGKETVARQVKDRSWYYLGDDIVLVENNIVGAYERAELRWTLIGRDGSRKLAVLNIRLYSAVEIASLLKDAGFDDISIFGDLQGRPYDVQASLLVAVARKS